MSDCVAPFPFVPFLIIYFKVQPAAEQDVRRITLVGAPILTKVSHRYRLRVINSGSDSAITFSIDYHPLLVIEADRTLVTPTAVTNITVNIAQRYSVIITTNQTEEPEGNYWVRAELQDVAPVAGTNTDIRAIVRYNGTVCTPTTSSNPGVPNSDLSALNEFNLVPAIPITPPPATLYVARLAEHSRSLIIGSPGSTRSISCSL